MAKFGRLCPDITRYVLAFFSLRNSFDKGKAGKYANKGNLKMKALPTSKRENRVCREPRVPQETIQLPTGLSSKKAIK